MIYRQPPYSANELGARGVSTYNSDSMVITPPVQVTGEGVTTTCASGVFARQEAS